MLGKLQADIRDWRMYNFPDTTYMHQYVGMVEELGELSHAILKESQGIRNIEDVDGEMKDAIGDLSIFMINFCDMHGWDYEKVLAQTWDIVAGRDWRKNPRDGVDG